MGRRTLNYRFIKTLRVASWCLLALMLAFLLSGYTMTGRFHFGRWMRAETALKIHRALHYPLAVVLVAHAVPGMYFAWRRWHKRRKTR